MNIRKTKKEIKKTPSGRIWLEHTKFWMLNAVTKNNNYRGISRFFYDVDITELSKITGISKQKIRKFIIMVI